MDPNTQNEVVLEKKYDPNEVAPEEKCDPSEVAPEAKEEPTAPPPPKTPRRLHKTKTQYMVTLAILVALTVVLQVVGALIPPLGATSWSFVLIPILVGGLVLGVRAGGVLGLTFGVVTVILGLSGMDRLTAYMMYYNGSAFGLELSPSVNMALNLTFIILLCLVKAVAAGVIPPLVHRSLHRMLPRGSVWVSAALAPIVNTSIFMIGSMFMLTPLAERVGDVAYFLLFTILVCNFLPELALNLVSVPAIYRVTNIVVDKHRK